MDKLFRANVSYPYITQDFHFTQNPWCRIENLLGNKNSERKKQ
jgi:hypothetical protein